MGFKLIILKNNNNISELVVTRVCVIDDKLADGTEPFLYFERLTDRMGEGESIPLSKIKSWECRTNNYRK